MRTHYCNKKGEVLPDAFLMKKGSNPHDVAFQVHTDIGKGFLYAVDARTKMRIKENHVLKDGDIIKIVSQQQSKWGATSYSMTSGVLMSDNSAAHEKNN